MAQNGSVRKVKKLERIKYTKYGLYIRGEGEETNDNMIWMGFDGLVIISVSDTAESVTAKVQTASVVLEGTKEALLECISSLDPHCIPIQALVAG